jgi:hypothetical protein
MSNLRGTVPKSHARMPRRRARISCSPDWRAAAELRPIRAALTRALTPLFRREGSDEDSSGQSGERREGAPPSPSGGGSDGHSTALATGVLSERPMAVRGGVRLQDLGEHPLPSAFGARPPPSRGRWKRLILHVAVLHPIALGNSYGFRLIGSGTGRAETADPPHPEERPQGASRRVGRSAPSGASFETRPAGAPQDEGSGLPRDAVIGRKPYHGVPSSTPASPSYLLPIEEGLAFGRGWFGMPARPALSSRQPRPSGYNDPAAPCGASCE